MTLPRCVQGKPKNQRSPTPDDPLEKRRQQNRRSQHNYRRRVQSKLQLLDTILNDEDGAELLGHLPEQRNTSTHAGTGTEGLPIYSPVQRTSWTQQAPNLPGTLDFDFDYSLTPLPQQSGPTYGTSTTSTDSDLFQTPLSAITSTQQTDEPHCDVHRVPTGRSVSTNREPIILMANASSDIPGSSPARRNSNYAKSPMLYDAVVHGHIEVARILLANAANPRTADSRGRTALHAAAERDDVPMIELLLSYSASIDELDHEGNAPLRLAVVSGSARATQALLAAGACLNIE